MEKATGDKTSTGKDTAPRPRGPKNDTKRVTREEVRAAGQCTARIALQGLQGLLRPGSGSAGRGCSLPAGGR